MLNSGRITSQYAPLAIILLLGTIIHTILIFYDIHSNFIPFQAGDRSLERLEAIAALSKATNWHDWLSALVSQGIIGDYFFHYLLYITGGPLLVIITQVVLQLISVITLFKIIDQLTDSKRWSFIGAITYLLMPHSLVMPHQIVSEGISVPFIIFSVYFWLLALQTSKRKFLVYSMLFISAAILIRPVFILLLPIFAIIELVALIFRKDMDWRGVRYIGIASIIVSIPFLVWLILFSSVNGHMSYGNTRSNLGFNLQKRAVIVSMANGIELPAHVYELTEQGIPVSEFLSFVAAHPYAYAEAYSRDFLIMFFRSGLNKLTTDYLNPPPLGTYPFLEWRLVWERDGTIAALKYLVNLAGFTQLIGEAVGCLFMGALTLTASFTSLWILFRAPRANFAPWKFSALNFCTAVWALALVSSILVSDTQSRIRYPAEFALIALAMFALNMGLQRTQNRKAAASARGDLPRRQMLTSSR
jgi:hypothetical protein